MAEREEIEKELKRFSGYFSDSEACLRFLEEFKWKKGFVCPHCGNLNSCMGKSPHSRRCTRCKKEISPTAHTIFHHCRIPLKKAFEIVYLSCRFPDISSYELHRILGTRRMTCYSFQKKVKLCKGNPGDEELLNEIKQKVSS